MYFVQYIHFTHWYIFTYRSDLFILASGRWFHVKISLPWVVSTYWMINRGPGFLAVVWFGSFPTHSHPLLSVTSTCDEEEDWERETTGRRDMGEGGGGAKTYHGEKGWSSINHLLLSDLSRWMCNCALNTTMYLYITVNNNTNYDKYTYAYNIQCV